MNKLIWTALIATNLAVSLSGQEPNEGFVMESEAAQHLLHHSDPLYPPIAKAAHVQGSVLLHVDVDTTGKVTKIEAIGGPLMLRQTAIDAVKTWTYQPFAKNGVIGPARLIVSVPFSLGIPAATEKSDNAIQEAYFPKEDECRAANAAGQWKHAIDVCAQAVAIADRFPSEEQRANEIRLAHQNYGEALAFDGELPAALKEFDRIVANAEKYLKPTDAEYGSVFYWRAFAEHASRMRDEAERDYQTAEASYRKAILNLPEMKTIYSRYLAHTLAYHSILADQTGRLKEAQDMRAEAIALDPNALNGLPKKE